MYVCIYTWCTIRHVENYTYHYVYTILIRILYDYHCVYMHNPLPSLTGLPKRTWGHSAAPYQRRMHFGLLQLTEVETRASKLPNLTTDPMSSWSMVLSWFCLFFPQLDTSAGLVFGHGTALPSSSWGKQPPSRDGQTSVV